MTSEATFAAAVELFNDGKYLASHELFDELWEATESAGADFYKGLIQAAIALHHFQEGNLEGATKLYGGHRRFLAAYLPAHRGVDVAGFLEEMQRFLRPVVRRAPGTEVPYDHATRPQMAWSPGSA